MDGQPDVPCGTAATRGRGYESAHQYVLLYSSIAVTRALALSSDNALVS
jgi:hypothetical protein